MGGKMGALAKTPLASQHHSGLGRQRIRGLRARCRLGVRLCDLEKDLHELFLRRVRGLEVAREAMGKVEGRRRARSKKERD